ncbi:MAG: hypothetical protein IJ367_01145, partial [Clostridia bacterium]|nr:hypothetical protein [Clostridia bacterium]
LGFSEHAPFRFPDGYETTYHRIFIADVPTYLAEANRLREKYQSQIDIKIGYELEYYPLYFPKMLKMALDFGAEYLILGQHYLNNEYPDGFPSGVPTTDDAVLTEYTDCVLKGIQTGVFTYVAHPDFIHYQGKNEALYQSEMEKICLASKEYNIPLEINLNGARTEQNYPCDRFFQIAGKVGCPITIGMDAHRTQDVFDKENIEMAKDMIKRLNLNYIGKPNLKLLQDKKEELLKKFATE